MKTLFLCLFVVAALWAQPAFEPPQVGFILDGHHLVHRVNGLAGNFLLSGAGPGGVISAAFSGSFRLLKADTTLSVTDNRGHAIFQETAPSGKALFAFSDRGVPALAYFESTNAMRAWNGRKFVSVDLAATGVLSIAAPNSREAALIVERDDGLWELRVLLATGAVISQMALPGVSAPVLVLAGGELIYRDTHGAVVRRPDGSEKHIAVHLPPGVAFSQMGEGWVQATGFGSGRLFAISLEPRHERCYVLPEVRR